ncbi:MAG: ADP-ribosylglycohydrolase family protein [Myxococcota bacterium]
MSLSFPELQDRYRAAVLGFAVGDALGFPLRGVPPDSLGRLPALAEDFAPRPKGKFAKGQFSDDTQLLLAAAESVAREGKIDGRSAAAHLAWLWEEGVILQAPHEVNEAAQRLLAGTPWMSAGAPFGVREPSALSRGVVVGLWHALFPERIVHDAAVLTVITHKDPCVAAACAAVARGVSLCLQGEPFTPSSFCTALAAAAEPLDASLAEELHFLPRALAWEAPRALAHVRKVGVPAALLAENEGVPPHVTPVLLVALYALLKAPHDFREALSLVLRLGGETDVTAAACGALMGANLGTEAIPARLRRNVLYAEHLVEAADRLFSANKVVQPVTAVVRRRR